MKFARALSVCLMLVPLLACGQSKQWLVFEGKEGAGKGKHIVLISGDDEYRSEEALPMLARILSVRHGFKCTVLFPLNAEGIIEPSMQTNIPGMDALSTADLCVMSLRFRELPDEQMKHFVNFFNAGKPIVALRTSTHAFAYARNKQSAYAKFDWQSKEWPGGFGQQVLGDTWVAHHGQHGKQSTRGVINESFKNHPLLRGVTDVWGPTDVYSVTHLPKDAQVLLWGQVLSGMKPDDKPLEGSKNDPMMPLAWIREYAHESGKRTPIFATTMGAAVDLQNEGLRRLLVNACYWGAGLEKMIRADSDVRYVGDYQPTWFGFKTFKTGVKPADLDLKP